MIPAFALKLFSTPGCSRTAPGIGMPCDIGASLFKSLLARENRSVGEMKRGRMVPRAGDKKFGAAGLKSNREHGNRTESIADDLSILSESGLPISLLKMDPKSAAKLISFLQGKGVSREKALAMVKSATGKDGFIHVDRLMAGLGRLSETAVGKQKGLMIAERDVPQVQKLLFQMGIGAGEVKTLSEESDDGKGNMILSKLVAGLDGKFLPMDAQKKLIPLLARFGIRCVADNVTAGIGKTDLKTFMQAYGDTASEDLQKRIKSVLAGVLTKKGVPPEKVKSFLDGMSIEYAKTMSAAKGGKTGKGATAAQFGLWNGLVIKPQDRMRKDPWTEKILAILKDVRTGARKGHRVSGNSLQSILSEGVEKTGSDNRPGLERMASVLKSEKTASISKGQRKPTGKGLASKLSFTSGNPGIPATDLRGGAGNMLRTAQQAGTVGRTLSYDQTTSTIPTIVDRMQWMVEEGKQKARIQLSPPELGHIDLQLVMDHGHVRAQLGAENLLVKEMIESNVGQLKQQLAGLGFVVEEFNVYVGADNQRFSNGDDPWEQERGVGRLNGKSVAESEDLAPELKLTPMHPHGDDRYQINVRV